MRLAWVSLLLAFAAVPASAASITVYDRDGQRGERRSYSDDERDLGSWRDRIESIDVRDGRWELCRETNFRDCVTFGSGRHDLRQARLDGQVRSLRPVGSGSGWGDHGGSHGRDDDRDREVVSRADATFIAERLYEALLDRRGDQSGVRQAAQEIRDGNLRRQVDSMLRSSEFRHKQQSLSPEDLLDQIYSGLLGRNPDAGGRRTYLPQIQRGRYADVVITILESREFRSQLPGR